MTETMDLTRQEFTIRSTSAAEYSEFMASSFGPIAKAVRATDDNGRRLRADLTELCERYNTKSGSLAIPATYLQVLATTRRASG